MNQKINDIKKYVGLAKRANYIVYGAENLSKVNKKLFLVIYENSAGKNLIKIVQRIANKTQAKLLTFDKVVLQEILDCNNCKVIGIKNLGLANQIIKIMEEII